MNKYLIKDIVLVVNGSTPSTKREDFYNGDIVWITPKDLSNLNSKYISKGEKSITELGYRSCSTTLIPKGSILLSSRAPIGLLAIAKNELCTNQGFKNLVLNNDLVINEFLYYWLKTKIEYISSLGTGTTFKEVSKHVIENIEIDLPSYSTQKQIAKVLSDLDAKIEVNNKINEELEAMAKTLYDYWFVQFDFPDENGKPYKSSGGKMVYNKELKREIPEGWEVKQLQDITKCIMGQSPKGESYNNENIGIPLLNGPADYENGALVGRTFTTAPTRLCKKDDLVLCIRATIGNLVYSEGEFCLGRGVAAVRPIEERLSELIYYILLQEIERFKIQATGSIIKGITKSDLTESKCLLPTDKLITKFHNQIKPIFDKERINKIESLKLAELRDWLLPMFMNGQVSVGE